MVSQTFLCVQRWLNQTDINGLFSLLCPEHVLCHPPKECTLSLSRNLAFCIGTRTNEGCFASAMYWSVHSIPDWTFSVWMCCWVWRTLKHHVYWKSSLFFLTLCHIGDGIVDPFALFYLFSDSSGVPIRCWFEKSQFWVTTSFLGFSQMFALLVLGLWDGWLIFTLAVWCSNHTCWNMFSDCFYLLGFALNPGCETMIAYNIISLCSYM